MDTDRSLKILELPCVDVTELSFANLKSQYHKLALRHHPDKNGSTPNATIRFQEINDAYHHLEGIVGGSEPTSKQCDISYASIFKAFVESCLNNSPAAIRIIGEIFCKCSAVSMTMFEGMDQDTILDVYKTLVKYKKIFHVTDETLNKLESIMKQRFTEFNLYILNPSLDDLLSSNIYKLVHDGLTYYVPLWHGEIYFDNNIVVRCIPDIVDGWSIDEENVLSTHIKVELNELLLVLNTLEISMGSQTLFLPLRSLSLSKHQMYVFHNQGVAILNESDVYDATTKSDVFVHVELFASASGIGN